jgi:hypothetical protein
MRLRPAWIQTSLCIQTLLQVEKLIAKSMDPDQTARRLVWINAGRKPNMLILSWRGSSDAYECMFLFQIMFDDKDFYTYQLKMHNMSNLNIFTVQVQNIYKNKVLFHGYQRSYE